MKSGNLNFLETSGTLQAYNGTDVPSNEVRDFINSLQTTSKTTSLCRCNEIWEP